MGLSKSIRRRLQIIEGDSISTSFKIFFADRKTRRAYEYNKFGRYLNESTTSSDGRWRTETDAINANLDPIWYAQTHNLSQTQSCFDHYCDEGRKFAFAPNSALAGEDGKSLSAWGLEYLVRCGIKIGCRGERALSPDDSQALDPFKITNSSGKKIAVVTAIFGDYDNLMPFDPAWKSAAEFFVFSEKKIESLSGWQQVHSPYHHIDPRRRARFIKLCLPVFFDNFEWVLWVDGNVLLCRDPQAIIAGIGDTTFDFAAFKHSSRNSVISEAAACAQLGKENAIELAEHLARIDFSSKKPADNLYETMAMVLRPSSLPVQKMFATWWGLLSKGSKRDQLSLPLAMAEVPEIKFAPFTETIDHSAEFFRTKHYAKTDKI
ncbi:glycosyltransferase domain-containing protein [Ruegeria arenilitoris]|uniref:glycosyltransferase domain-containing protein n=1 Tax=Ruegeria arenilitoris TaxID=1173585 RepID=UPI00147C81B7|nr:glycosyltransferase domain-containing protein [Ruegeria arenilitoris]